MVTQNDKKLGERIQKLRKQAGLTQEQLAEKVGVTMKYIQFIESAQRKPALKTVYKIAKVLNIRVQELFPF